MNERVKKEFQADLLEIRELDAWLRLGLAELEISLSVKGFAKMHLAVHELAVNVIDHAYENVPGNTFALQLSRIGDKVEAELRDGGLSYEGDLDTVGPKTELSVRGYGLFIVKQLSEQLSYRREGSINIWSLRFAIDVAEEVALVKI